MSDISKITTPNGTTYNLKDEKARTDINAKVSKSGDTMTGALTTPANQNYESGSKYAIDLKNSDVIGANAIYFNDLSEAQSESLNFYRDASHYDSFRLVNGKAYITPYRPKNGTATDQELYSLPTYQAGTNDPILQTRNHLTRPNRLSFLPADQIIIEQTTDGGTTWTSANVSDDNKAALFSGVTNSSITIPLLNGAKSTNCGLRVTFTAMKYNVPSGTSETDKYQYWNNNYVNKTERYCSLKYLWFWLSSNNDAIKIQVYRATGANPDNWINTFNTDFAAQGFSGSDWVSFTSDLAFGGGTTKTGNYWNYRITFFSRMRDGDSKFRSNTAQTIQKILGYGQNCWSAPNNLMNTDHLYSMDVNQNAIFPAKITATEFIGSLAASRITGSLGLANGGTGATTAAAARTNLGLRDASTHTVETTLADDAKLPTGHAVKTYVDTICGDIETLLAAI